MMTPRSTLCGFLSVLLVAILASFGAHAAQISLVVDDAGALNSGDQTVQNALLNLGHTVMLHDDGGITAAATAGSDAIVISSTVGSDAVSAVFKADSRPVVTWESGTYDDLGMTGEVENTDFGFALGEAQIDLIAASTPIGDGLTLGPITVTGQLEDLAWGVPGGDGIVVATLPGDPTRATIFVYGQGDTLADGTTAAGKRVGFFPDNDSASVFAADGLTLLEQVIAWALTPVQVAPIVITPPYSETVVEGATATFTVVAGGNPEPTYQWQKDGIDLPGETGNTLSFATAAGDEGDYTVVLTNSEGSLSSDPVPLTFVDAWTFAFVVGNTTLSASDQRIHDKVVALGHSVTVHDDDGITIGATAGTDAVLIASSVTGATVGGTFTSDTRPILLWEAAIYGDMGLTGDVHDVDLGAVPGQTQIDLIDVNTRIGYGFPLGRLTVTASSQNMNWGIVGPEAVVIATLVGQPERANVFSYAPGALLVDGSTAAGLRIALDQTNDSAANWAPGGEQLFEQAVSALFLPAPLVAPTITTQPQSDSVVEGETATFTVVAEGAPAPTYQWRFEGVDLPGETDATLTFTAALEDAGDYDVVVTNDQGSVTSDVATLTVVVGNGPPTFTSTPVIDATQGILYVYDVTATDPNAGDTLTISATDLPAWLSLVDNGDGTAELSGTPSEGDIGAHAITLEVEDAGGLTATQDFAITVVENAAADGPVITLNGSAQVVVRQGQTFTDPGATASDPQDGDLTSAIEVDGTVNTQVVGTYTLTYSVTDTAGNEAQAQRSVVVQRPPDDGGGGGAAGFVELLALALLAAGAPRRRLSPTRRR
jgi:hypothetical protein